MPGELVLVLIVYSLGSGILAMLVAEAKGHGGGWFLAGLLLGFIGVIAAAGLPVDRKAKEAASSDSLTKECPDCAERVRVEAHVCRHCHHRFSDDDIVREYGIILSEGDPSELRSILPIVHAAKDEQLLAPLLKATRTITSGIRHGQDINIKLLRELTIILSEWEYPTVLPELDKIASHGNQFTRPYLLQAIASKKSTEAATILCRYLDESSTREIAGKLIVGIGSAAIPALEEVIQQGEKPQRKAAQRLRDQIRG